MRTIKSLKDVEDRLRSHAIGEIDLTRSEAIDMIVALQQCEDQVAVTSATQTYYLHQAQWRYIKEIAESDQKVQAVKQLRADLRVGLKTAKEIFDNHFQCHAKTDWNQP